MNDIIHKSVEFLCCSPFILVYFVTGTPALFNVWSMFFTDISWKMLLRKASVVSFGSFAQGKTQ